MHPIEKEIDVIRTKLDKWLLESYGDSYGDFYPEHDISYEHWSEIEILLKELFEGNFLTKLSSTCLSNILFFISRSEEGGRIIAWLNPMGKSLSNIANLTEENFSILCKYAVMAPDDFCDYQLASCFSKFDDLSPEFEGLLISFFKKQAIYTKRMALVALAKHNTENLETFIVELWNTQDEWARLNCLEALQSSGCNNNLYDQYKNVLLKSSDLYIRENAEKM